MVPCVHYQTTGITELLKNITSMITSVYIPLMKWALQSRSSSVGRQPSRLILAIHCSFRTGSLGKRWYLTPFPLLNRLAHPTAEHDTTIFVIQLRWWAQPFCQPIWLPLGGADATGHVTQQAYGDDGCLQRLWPSCCFAMINKPF